MLNDPNFMACLTKLVSVCNGIQTNMPLRYLAGTKLGPDHSLDPGRINSDQPGSTRINLDRLKL